MKFLRNAIRAFARNKRANVAMMFGIALVPITIAAGVGLDYSRAALKRSQMSDALDAAALAIGSTPGLTTAQAKALAQSYFQANYKGDTSTGIPQINVDSYDTAKGSVALSINTAITTSVLKAVGVPQVAVTTSSTVVWGQSKLWVALVLDNSGSMCQPDSQPCVDDSNTKSKIYQLKDATKSMLTKLQSVSTTAGDVQVSIVPFNREVSMSNAKVSTSAIDWTFWEQAGRANDTTTITDTYYIANQTGVGSTTPSTLPFTAWGPGDDCPFTTTSNKLMSPFGFYCMPDGTNQSTGNRVSSIPSSGSTKGLICPSLDSGNYNKERNDRYYNGCWTSTKDGSNTVTVDSGKNSTCSGFSNSNCTCNGNSNATSRTCTTQRWKHTWVPNNHNTWGGCVTDRAQDYDIGVGSVASSFPADNPYSSPMIPNSSTQCMNGIVTPLGYNWTDLANKVDDMQAGGSTNQAIGVAHGWQTLTPGSPYGAPTVPANTTRYIILLSDGLNTQNRWWGDGSTEGTSDDDKIDDRMGKVCTAAKADGVIIYTLYVHTNGSGDSSVLSSCASDSSKFFDLTSSDQIATAFATITQQITNVRVSK